MQTESKPMRVLFESTKGDISGPRYVKREQLHAAEHPSDPQAGRAFVRGVPYFVTAPMAHLMVGRCYQRGRFHGDPPTPTGFMWFQKKIEQFDGGLLRAIAWETLRDGGIAYYWYGWHPLGSKRYVGLESEVSDNETRDLLFTAFGVMEERISVVSRVPSATPGRMRLQGRKETEDVRVIELRAVDRVGKVSSGDTHEYTCQWMVRGHPHRYWVGAGDDRHLEIRHVRPYMKGPSHAPLKEPTPPVYAVTR